MIERIKNDIAAMRSTISDCEQRIERYETLLKLLEENPALAKAIDAAVLPFDRGMPGAIQ